MTQYLNDDFRNANPNDYDIITALYGTGDEGSIYTQNWSGYNSGSCLSAGMSVVYTGNLTWGTLTANTIYVVASWTYNITSAIEMAECGALISSGDITLWSTITHSNILSISGIHNVILDNIDINWINTSKWISVFSGHSNTLHAIKSTYNSENGLYIEKTTHNVFSEIISSNNIWTEINVTQSAYNIFTNITWSNSINGGWISISLSWYNILDNIVVFNNKLDGIIISNSHNNTFTNSNVYWNGWTYHGWWIKISNNSTYNNFINAEIHNNILFGLQLNTSTYNTIQNFHIYKNDTYGIEISDNSNHNNFSWIDNHENLYHGIYISSSSYNIFSWVTSSWNNIWVYLSSSSYNTWNNIISTNNLSRWLAIIWWQNNTLQNIIIQQNNAEWIIISNDSLSTRIVWATISWNTNYGLKISASNSTLLSWITLTNNQSGDIYLSSSSWTIIQNTISSSLWWYSLTHNNSLYSSIQNFSGTRSMYDTHTNGILYTNRYDSQTLSKTFLYGYASWFAQITGTTLTPWSIYSHLFDTLLVDSYSGNSLQFSWVSALSVSGAIWDGKIYSPITISLQPFVATTSETGTTSIKQFLKTISIYSWDTYLILDDGIWEIHYYVWWWSSGQTLQIFSSLDGNTWTPNTRDTQCVLGSWWLCVFECTGTTKLFALGYAQIFFSWTTQAGITISSWSMYNTGIYITYTGNTISGATLNGLAYTNNTLITGNNSYTFVVYDTNGYSTGITFGIDTIAPIFTGTSQSNISISSGSFSSTGVRITFSDPHLSGAIVNGLSYTNNTLLSWDSIYTFDVSDTVGNTTWMRFTIDHTSPLITAIYPNTGLNITGTNDIEFTRSWLDTNLSGYTLYITGTEIHTYTTLSTWYTNNNLHDGTYTRYVIATDLAGNTWTSVLSTFTITTPLSGTVLLSWWNMIKIWSMRYTDWDATFDIHANKSCIYMFTWEHITSFSGIYTSNIQISRTITWNDGDKNIYITLSTWVEAPIQTTTTIKLDTTTYPATLISPLTGTIIWSWVFTLRWSPSSTPESVGYSWYIYYISNTGTFATPLISWFTTSTGVNISGLQTTWVFYWKIDAIDKLGNTSGSSIWSFIYDNISDTTPNNFSFNDIDDARRDRIYVSNTVYITGMTSGVNVLASITNGALHISGDMVGKTWYIQNGRPVKIELISSNDYDEIVSSILTINGISDTFSITTEEDNNDNNYEDIETNLSNTEKLTIIAIFEALKNIYDGDKEEEFFNTFMVILENKIDDYTSNDDEYDWLTYLSDIIHQYYELGDFGDNVDTTPWIINGIYTAPNGKRYTITYDSSKQRFTSTNFIVPKYFPTLDVLKHIIDINNPIWSQYSNAKPILARWKTATIDGTRQTSPYTAPNRKVFYFFKTIDDKYTSYTFTSEKWFDSLNDVKEFIFNSNKK